MRSSMVWEYDFSYSTPCYVVNCRFLSRVTDRYSPRLRMSGLLLPAFSDGFMACRFNRSIPAHSIPVPPSLRGLSSHHPISCRRVLPAPKGLRLPCSYLLGLPPSGSSFQRAVAAPLAFPVRREDNIYVCEFYVNKNFIYVYVESKNTADTTKARRSRPAGHKKPLTGRGEEVPKDLWENLLNIF